jgi:phosphatidylglycerol:prolipoprotein diacylglycerol transferase
MGCFLVGDDYGLPTDSALGMVFPEQAAIPSTAGYLRTVGAEIPPGVPDAALLAVHPTQLYEIAAALIMFAILWRVSRWALRPGRLFALFLALYGIERFLIEFVRAKDDRFVLGLTTSQMMSLLLLGAAAYLWTRQAAATRGGREVS